MLEITSDTSPFKNTLTMDPLIVGFEKLKLTVFIEFDVYPNSKILQPVHAEPVPRMISDLVVAQNPTCILLHWLPSNSNFTTNEFWVICCAVKIHLLMEKLLMIKSWIAMIRRAVLRPIMGIELNWSSKVFMNIEVGVIPSFFRAKSMLPGIKKDKNLLECCQVIEHLGTDNWWWKSSKLGIVFFETLNLKL